jgi:hypothetical protein
MALSGRSAPGVIVITNCMHLHATRRSSVSGISLLISLSALQHGSGGGIDESGFLRYGKHVGIKACLILSHNSAGSANEMPKNKLITTKQVTLMRIEFAMIEMQFECVSE